MNLVTGAAGLLGSHIAERLVQDGQNVRVLIRSSSDTSLLDTLGVEKTVGDLTDPDSVGIDIAFTNAGWYRFCGLCLWLPDVVENPTVSDWHFALADTGNEFETAGEAAGWFNSDEFRATQLWRLYGFPLCGLVLKNNGTPGAGCPIEPVDLINRGRSYMWPTDLRPRKVII